MARKDSDHQKKSMSALFRGRAIFKPLNTGWIDTGVACVREWVANIFFYTKNGTTIMIDAGYNYARLQEKMGWLDIDPASIRHIHHPPGHRPRRRAGEGQRAAVQKCYGLHRRDRKPLPHRGEEKKGVSRLL